MAESKRRVDVWPWFPYRNLLMLLFLVDFSPGKWNVMVHGSPILLPLLEQGSTMRVSKPPDCMGRGGESGVCIFAWDCMKGNGSHMGICVDGFYFRSCCQLPEGTNIVQLLHGSATTEEPDLSSTTSRKSSTESSTNKLSSSPYTSSSSSTTTTTTTTESTSTTTTTTKKPQRKTTQSTITTTTHILDSIIPEKTTAGNSEKPIDNDWIPIPVIHENTYLVVKPPFNDDVVEERESNSTSTSVSVSTTTMSTSSPASSTESVTLSTMPELMTAPAIVSSTTHQSRPVDIQPATEEAVIRPSILPPSTTIVQPALPDLTLPSSLARPADVGSTTMPTTTNATGMTTETPLTMISAVSTNTHPQTAFETGGSRKPSPQDSSVTAPSSTTPAVMSTEELPTSTVSNHGGLSTWFSVSVVHATTKPSIVADAVEETLNSTLTSPSDGVEMSSTSSSISSSSYSTAIETSTASAEQTSASSSASPSSATTPEISTMSTQTTEGPLPEKSTFSSLSQVTSSTSAPPSTSVTSSSVSPTTTTTEATTTTTTTTTAATPSTEKPSIPTTILPESSESTTPTTTLTTESTTTITTTPATTTTTLSSITTKTPEMPILFEDPTTVNPQQEPAVVSIGPAENRTSEIESSTTSEEIVTMTRKTTEALVPTIPYEPPALTTTPESVTSSPDFANSGASGEDVTTTTSKEKTTTASTTTTTTTTTTTMEPTKMTSGVTTTSTTPVKTATPTSTSTTTTTTSTTNVTTTRPPSSTSSGDARSICGRQYFPSSRIVGGNRAEYGEWPWQVSLRQWRTAAFLHKCGAALLNENWAITAAHCVENVPPEDIMLRLGEYDLASEKEPYGYVERRVQIIASHPNFDPRTFEYDLALLRFYEPVQFQPNIIPICLPEDDKNFLGSSGFVTGWGRLYEDGPLPSVMQEVMVPVVNNSDCEVMYRRAGYNEHIPNIFLCAGYAQGGLDSCEGDSGGPLVIQREDSRWLLAGIISWGIGCAEPNQPGVYTRISQFRNWINQIIVF